MKNNYFTFIPLWQQFILVLLFNTAIALFLSALITNSNLWLNLILSQSIGLTIFLSYLIYYQFFSLTGWKIIIPLVVGACLGVLIGAIIQSMIMGASIEQIAQATSVQYKEILRSIGIALFFGSIIFYFFLNREKTHKTEAKLQEEKISKLDIEKQMTETRLRLLQAQIEPHFLFNSLSNVIGLIEAEPGKSKLLLEKLSRFLRSTLTRSYNEKSVLRDEVELIKNYLDIFKIRMGDRLQYKISAPEDLMELYFPPMLLQPLIENSIKHGLEPLAQGGEIELDILLDGILKIMISDTGTGLGGDTMTGFGLQNVKDRLQSVYGASGKLTIKQNKPGGVRVTIEVPCEKH